MNENERSGTIGLDWLEIGCGEGGRGGRGMAASLVSSAHLSLPLSPHSTSSQSLSSPPSTSI